MSEEIRSILIAGGGQMGSGIAQVAAQAGCEVLLYDVDEERIRKAILSIGNHLAGSVTKGRMTEEQRAEVLSRIRGSDKLEAACKVDCVIEAVTEKLAVKKSLFRELDTILCCTDDIGNEYLFSFSDGTGSGNRAPRSGYRAAFHESSPGDEACRAY